MNIDTDLELMLPDDYVNSTEERLLLYQKLADVKNAAELSRFEYELNDRFGALPKEAINLLKSIELKWLAADIGFDKIVMKTKSSLDISQVIHKISFIRVTDLKRLFNTLVPIRNMHS